MGSLEHVRLDRQDPYLSLHSINVYVRDQERSLNFYVEKLGFTLAQDLRLQTGERLVAVAPPDGSTVLRLLAPEPGSEQEKYIGRPTHIMFLTEDVMAKFREWNTRGVRFRRTPRLRRIRYAEQTAAPVWGAVFASFEDPDGNWFALAGFDDVSRELQARRRAHAEKLEAERRAAQEIEIARQVQARLFPQMQPPLDTLEYAGLCVQARRVGGDYYDFLDLGQDRLGLVLADIAGKGIAAALVMANLQANLRSQCAIAIDHPRRFLRSVNQLFFENTVESAYATLFFAEYDDRLRRLRYANCGHLDVLLFREENCLERLESTSTVLGLFADWDCSIAECQLSSGDALLLYTDGVTEACNEAGEDFGQRRLVEAFCRYRGLPAPAMVSAIQDEVKNWSPQEQQDDITLIVAQCR